MFSEKDKSLIRQDYFNVTILSDSFAELESENGDWWMILEVQQWLSRRQRASQTVPRVFYRLMHRHANSEAYHDHSEHICILDVILEITNHDDYRLKRHGQTHFDEILKAQAAV